MAAGGGHEGWVRSPAVAGLFYPRDPDELRAAVARHVASAPPAPDEVVPKALIAPHAGYRYSGPTAGAAYRAVAARKGQVQRVVVAGPAHRVPVQGVGVTTARAWHTPLGDVEVDVDACEALLDEGRAVAADDAHRPEHSIEVHLPFLVEVLGPVALIPLVVGRCAPATVAEALAQVWGGDETLVVVSSDLSHYLDDASARTRDQRTRRAILEGRAGDIGPYDACGCVPVAGLILAARARHIVPRTLAVATSADTSGDTRRVVGYGSFGFGPPCPLSDGDQRWLLARARAAIAHELTARKPDPLTDEDVPEHTLVPGATFVTLERDGELVGCIGSLEPRRPLWRDVARNARAAAFADPRFPALMPGDLDRTVIKVSVLSGLDPLPAGHDDLVDTLRPGIDGVLLEAGGHRGTFLPAVWEKLPAPEQFVDRLVGKAGLPEKSWPEDAQVWRYTTDEFADA
jgi:MEMO1 family protein